jgi:deazaflavin-dependent oxidoreductase (nitroreductase family)
MDIDRDALASHQTIEISTVGRQTGKHRRIEIWWFEVDGRYVITGTPGKRDWLANLEANPRLVIHVDGEDIEATASLIDDLSFRRRVFTRPQTRWYTTQAELEHLVAAAPMVEIHLPD